MEKVGKEVIEGGEGPMLFDRLGIKMTKIDDHTLSTFFRNNEDGGCPRTNATYNVA